MKYFEKQNEHEWQHCKEAGLRNALIIYWLLFKLLVYLTTVIIFFFDYFYCFRQVSFSMTIILSPCNEKILEIRYGPQNYIVCLLLDWIFRNFQYDPSFITLDSFYSQIVPVVNRIHRLSCSSTGLIPTV